MNVKNGDDRLERTGGLELAHLGSLVSVMQNLMEALKAQVLNVATGIKQYRKSQGHDFRNSKSRGDCSHGWIGLGVS